MSEVFDGIEGEKGLTSSSGFRWTSDEATSNSFRRPSKQDRAVFEDDNNSRHKDVHV